MSIFNVMSFNVSGWVPFHSVMVQLESKDSTRWLTSTNLVQLLSRSPQHRCLPEFYWRLTGIVIEFPDIKRKRQHDYYQLSRFKIQRTIAQIISLFRFIRIRKDELFTRARVYFVIQIFLFVCCLYLRVYVYIRVHVCVCVYKYDLFRA